ncbi:hypothetical protein ACTGWM_09905 [Streptococcus suis]
MKKLYKKVKRFVPLALTSILLIGGGIVATPKAEADTYSPWVVVSKGPIKYENITYNGFKPMIRKFRFVKFRRTYVDNSGNAVYLYKTEVENLGMIPR